MCCHVIALTCEQDLIISYCKNKFTEQGSINVSNILNGKCIAKVQCKPNNPMEVCTHIGIRIWTPV